jgi:hypothetical protein
MIVKRLGISNKNTPEITAPSGAPSVTIVSDVLRVANNPSITARWFGRPVMKPTGKTYNGKPVWMCCYAQSEAHHLLTWSQLHLIFSNDYGDTWSDQNKYLDGSDISGTPLYPVGANPGQNDHGPGDGWIYNCPNGDLLIHFWDSNYSDYNNGTWQTRSTNGGLSWSIPEKITFINNTGTANVNDRTLATDDSFIFNGIIYAMTREYQLPNQQYPSRTWFMKSVNNGLSWELVSLISSYEENTNEAGLTYVGNDRIVVALRELVGPPAYLTKSDDFGQTWNSLSDVSSSVGVWSRQRLKTRSQLKSKNRWWDDPVVLCNGFVHVNPGNSHPRRLSVWVSKDRGLTFSSPFYLKSQGYDGGYGDFLYNPIKDEYVTMQYYAPTSLYDGEIRQINWKLNFT